MHVYGDEGRYTWTFHITTTRKCIRATEWIIVDFSFAAVCLNISPAIRPAKTFAESHRKTAPVAAVGYIDLLGKYFGTMPDANENPRLLNPEINH